MLSTVRPSGAQVAAAFPRVCRIRRRRWAGRCVLVRPGRYRCASCTLCMTRFDQKGLRQHLYCVCGRGNGISFRTARALSMAFPRRSVLIPTIVVRSHATVLALAWASLCSDPPPPKGLCNSVGRQGLLFWFASWLEPCSGGPLCTWFGAEPGRLRALCGLAFVRVGSPINHRPVSRFLSWWWPSVAGP